MSEMSEERKRCLEDMWIKVATWVKRHCATVYDMKRIEFPHNTYHWTAFEIYPGGKCALLSGSHGNPGEDRPSVITGKLFDIPEQFDFGLADNDPSWYGRYEDLDRYRSNAVPGVMHYGRVRSFHMLDELFGNWQWLKQRILDAVDADKRLKEFEP